MSGVSKIDKVEGNNVTLRNGRVFKIDSMDKSLVQGWSPFDEVKFDISLVVGGLKNARTGKFVSGDEK